MFCVRYGLRLKLIWTACVRYLAVSEISVVCNKKSVTKIRSKLVVDDKLW